MKKKMYLIQSRFLWNIARLIIYAHGAGYEVTLGRGFLSPEQNRLDGSDDKSNHIIKLAQDLCFFKDGEYIRDTDSLKIFGDWWKEQDPLARWGGDFKKLDGNHFSFEFGGHK